MDENSVNVIFGTFIVYGVFIGIGVTIGGYILYQIATISMLFSPLTKIFIVGFGAEFGIRELLNHF